MATNELHSVTADTTSKLHSVMTDTTTQWGKVVHLQSNEGATFCAGWTATDCVKLLLTRKGACV
jgi:hypothetical protein